MTFALLRPGEFRLYYTDDSGTAVAINRVIAGSEGRLVSEKQFQSRSVPNDDDDGILNLELQLQAEAELEDERETAAHDIGPNKPPLIRPRGHGMGCIWDGGWYRWGGPIRVLFIGTGR